MGGTLLEGCSLFKWCWNLPAVQGVAGCLSQNLPAGNCVAGVQAVQTVSEPTSQALCCRGAVFLIGVGTYLLGTVGQRCRLFKPCWNLPPMHCGAQVQAV